MSTKLVRLKNLASVRVSNIDKKSADGEVPVRLCNYTDVYYADTIRPTGDFMTATASPDQVATFRLRSGQTLITKDSETADDIGVPAFVDGEVDDLVCGYHLAQITPKPDRVDPKFLFWAISSTSARQQLTLGASGVTRFGLRTDSITGLRLPMPHRSEQRQIADFLDAETARIDALIGAKQQMTATLRGRFTTYVRETLSREMRFADPLDVRAHEVEPGLDPVRLAWRFSFGSGTTPPAGDPQWYNGDVPWVVTGDLRDARLHSASRSVTSAALEEFSALRVHPAGSLVVAMYGATIGRMGLLEFDATVNQACCVLHPFADDTVEYVFYWLLGFRPELIQRGYGAGQPNISRETVASIRLAMPSRRGQLAVVERLDTERQRVDDLTATLTRQTDLLRERRQALITAAVSGEMEVT